MNDCPSAAHGTSRDPYGCYERENAEQRRIERAVHRHVGDLLQTLTSISLSQEMNEPHAVLTVDPETNFVQVQGPYPDGHQALIALDDLLKSMNDPKNNDGPTIVGTVVIFHDIRESR